MPACFQVYTGDGKGKTTAALGLLLRAAGAGKRIFFCQFLKDGRSGECKVLRERFPEIACRYYGSGAWIKDTPSAADRTAAQLGFEELCAAVTRGAYDLVIADEIQHAISLELIAIEPVIQLLKQRPSNVELVFTGRQADPRILEHADLISVIVCRRHPFERGIPARRGIDY